MPKYDIILGDSPKNGWQNLPRRLAALPGYFSIDGRTMEFCDHPQAPTLDYLNAVASEYGVTVEAASGSSTDRDTTTPEQLEA